MADGWYQLKMGHISPCRGQKPNSNKKYKLKITTWERIGHIWQWFVSCRPEEPADLRLKHKLTEPLLEERKWQQTSRFALKTFPDREGSFLVVKTPAGKVWTSWSFDSGYKQVQLYVIFMWNVAKPQIQLPDFTPSFQQLTNNCVNKSVFYFLRRI